MIVNNGCADSKPSIVTVTVNPSLIPPGPLNQYVTVHQSQSITLSLKSSNPSNCEIIEYPIQSGPANGYLNPQDKTKGQITYTPNTNFIGYNSFTFKVTYNCDGEF